MTQLDPSITLTIHIQAQEAWDEERERFVYLNHDVTFTLEHSLVSVSKWEAKFHKPFLDQTPKTEKEMIEYVKCMTIEKDIPEQAYMMLTGEDFEKIKKFIADPMSGYKFSKHYEEKMRATKKGDSIETAEEIYWSMIQCNIPAEWEHRHFNQLRTLIQLCAAKQDTDNKMPTNESRKLQHELNVARRQKLKARKAH